jgi:hypothetical protein
MSTDNQDVTALTANQSTKDVTSLPPTQSAEERAAHDDVMRQIFGDVGELVSGKTFKSNLRTNFLMHNFAIDFSCAVESTVLLHGKHDLFSSLIHSNNYLAGICRSYVYHRQVYMLLFQFIWNGEEDSNTLFAHYSNNERKNCSSNSKCNCYNNISQGVCISIILGQR